MFEDLQEAVIKIAAPWGRYGNQALLAVQCQVTADCLAELCDTVVSIVKSKQEFTKCQRLMVFFTFIKAFVVTLLRIRNSLDPQRRWRRRAGLSSRL